MGTLAAAVATTKAVEGEVAVREQDSSSAAAFVEGGVQDACDDSCSICLEPFSYSDPATVTSCRHEYHLQCILEWAQRSKECPMCWQTLSLEDPSSQELLDAVGHEQSRSNLEEVPAFANYAEFEDQIMQHLVHQMARRASLQNRSSPDNQVQPGDGMIQLPPLEFLRLEPMHSPSNVPIQSHGAQRSHSNSQQEMPSSNVSVVTESIKSRLLNASSKCKETLSRTTRSFKERWRGRNTKTADCRARGAEVSAEVVARQALKRISPEAVEKEDVPTTSNNCTLQSGISESTRKLEGSSMIGVSSQATQASRFVSLSD